MFSDLLDRNVRIGTGLIINGLLSQGRIYRPEFVFVSTSRRVCDNRHTSRPGLEARREARSPRGKPSGKLPARLINDLLFKGGTCYSKLIERSLAVPWKSGLFYLTIVQSASREKEKEVVHILLLHAVKRTRTRAREAERRDRRRVDFVRG